MDFLSPQRIIRRYAEVLHADAALRAWSQGRYGKAVQIVDGPDLRRGPGEQDAPYIVFLPEQGQAVTPEPMARHQLGMVLGVREPDMEAMPWGSRMAGLDVLDEEFLPLALAALGKTDCRPESADVEYVTETFPLVQLSVTLTVNERRPVGGRPGIGARR